MDAVCRRRHRRKKKFATLAIETTKIPSTTLHAMAPVFELELPPLERDPGEGEVDRVAVPVARAAVETPEGLITTPGPFSGVPEDVGWEKPRKIRG